jgi:hypothetical protein
MKLNYLYLFSGLLSAAILVGCGGGSGGGGTAATAADITADNADDLTMAATEAAKSAAESDTPDVNPFASPKTTVNNVANKAMNLSNQVTGFDDAYFNDAICPSGGSVTITGLDNVDQNTTNTNFDFDMSFNGCNNYGTIIESGSVSYSGDINGNFTMTYNNLQVTYGDQTETINGSMTCNSSGCTENLSYNGSFTNRTYQTENIQVSGNASSGYSVSGSVTDPDHGVIEISASGLIFNVCAGGQPSSGSITVTGANTTLEVIFDGCTSFTVTLDGVSETVLWADYGL